VFILFYIYIYFCTRIPVSASAPRCSIILVHLICLTFVSTHVYFDNKIQLNSIQSCYRPSSLQTKIENAFVLGSLPAVKLIFDVDVNRTVIYEILQWAAGHYLGSNISTVTITISIRILACRPTSPFPQPVQFSSVSLHRLLHVTGAATTACRRSAQSEDWVATSCNITPSCELFSKTCDGAALSHWM